MLVLKDYYKVESVVRSDGEAVYTVSLNPDCEVYRGHFPGSPVSPGVCNIQMIRECAQKECLCLPEAATDRPGLVGGAVRLYIDEIRQCRFTSLITPLTHPEVDVHISLSAADHRHGSPEDPGDGSGNGRQRFGLQASIVRDGTVCLSLKAVCRAVNQTEEGSQWMDL